MIKTLVVETNPERGKAIAKAVHILCAMEKWSDDVAEYLNAQDAADRIAQDAFAYDVILLNIDPEESTRIFCTLLRRENYAAALIFVGRDVSRFGPSLIHRPSAYLRLPVSRQVFLETLRPVYRQQHAIVAKRYFTYKTRGEQLRIAYSQIDFFERSGNAVYLHTCRDGIAHALRTTLAELMSELPMEQFVRVHQSIIVNMQNASGIRKDTKQIIFQSGRTADVSRRLYGEALAVYNQLHANAADIRK